MFNLKGIRRMPVATALAALSIGLPAAFAPLAPASAQAGYRPSRQLPLSTGEGQMITLPKSVASVWTSNPDVADVYVTTPTKINIFGKKMGDATVIATAKDGSVVYGANVHVSQNVGSVNDVLRAAMPGTDITVTPIGQIAVMNGTVSSPEEAAQAQAIVASILNPGKKEGDALDILPINRLRTAVPLQVNLKVKIAEVSRSALKKVGVNLLNRDVHSGHVIGIGQGSPGTIKPIIAPDDPSGLPVGGTAVTFNNIAGGTTLGLFGHIFGTDLLGTVDLLENDGFVTTLAEPNLTALSGETASFLAGGEFPIPVSQGLGGGVTIEYKQYGVSLAFTPIVLEDGRISMRVRPEVSQLSDAGSVTLNGYKVPALTSRRAETTVELGSGQSFMLAGLLQNDSSNTITKAPFLGDLPLLGTLFRSNAYQRGETELVIVVTPYLVRPVSGRLATPVDGYRTPTDAQQVFMGQTYTGESGPRRVPVGPVPAVGASTAAAAPGFKL